jgi:mono/diheme cytochrome c family protein
MLAAALVRAMRGGRTSCTAGSAHGMSALPLAADFQARSRFAGGPNPEGEGTIPNIAQHGIGDYSVKVIERVLETGETPEDTVCGAMLAVVRSTSQLPQSDRAAMAAYIKSLPPVE